MGPERPRQQIANPEDRTVLVERTKKPGEAERQISVMRLSTDGSNMAYGHRADGETTMFKQLRPEQLAEEYQARLAGELAATLPESNELDDDITHDRASLQAEIGSLESIEHEPSPQDAVEHRVGEIALNKTVADVIADSAEADAHKEAEAREAQEAQDVREQLTRIQAIATQIAADISGMTHSSEGYNRVGNALQGIAMLNNKLNGLDEAGDSDASRQVKQQVHNAHQQLATAHLALSNIEHSFLRHVDDTALQEGVSALRGVETYLHNIEDAKRRSRATARSL